MERKHSTETKRRVVRRSVSHSPRTQDPPGGNVLISAKATRDEVDNKKPTPQHDDKKSDVAKSKNRALQSKLKRCLNCIFHESMMAI